MSESSMRLTTYIKLNIPQRSNEGCDGERRKESSTRLERYLSEMLQGVVLSQKWGNTSLPLKFLLTPRCNKTKKRPCNLLLVDLFLTNCLFFFGVLPQTKLQYFDALIYEDQIYICFNHIFLDMQVLSFTNF